MINAFVHVIESPADRDLLDGRMEGKALCEALALAGIPYYYSLATSPQMFDASFTTRLQDAVAHFKKLPIIHLSLHGDTNGVQLTSGDVLTWENLRRIIDPITGALGELLVCMSSCSGASGCRMAMHTDPNKPFWALVGNAHDVAWADAAVAYITFYHQFFKGLPLDHCVERMKLASGDNNFMLFSGAKVKVDWAAHMDKSRKEMLVQAIRDYSSSQAGLLGGMFQPAP